MIPRICLLFIVSALSLLAQADSSASPRGYEAVQLGDARSSGHYLVDVRIERKPFRFLVDSGAGLAIVLSKPTARALRKRTSHAGEAGGFTGTVKMRKTKLKSFEVVGLSPVLKDPDVFVIDLGEVQVDEDDQTINPDGILGVRILDQWNAVIDMGSSRLLVPSAQTRGMSFTEWMQRRGGIVAPLHKNRDGFAMLDLTIKKKTYTFLVDSGAGFNTIEPIVARRLRLQVVAERGELAGIGKKVIKGLNVAEAEDVVLGGVVKVQQIQFAVHDHGTEFNVPEGKTFGGIIGSRTLAGINACLDFGTYSLIVPKPEDMQMTVEDTRDPPPGKLTPPVTESENPEPSAKPASAERPDSIPQPPPARRGF